MKKNEFRPLPDEFNLGYVPPAKEEEEEEKKKRRRKLRKLLLYGAVVFLILPFTLKTGLFEASGENGIPDSSQNGSESANVGGDTETAETENQQEEEKMPDGVYKSVTTTVCLDQGKGWYFNGEYFIPLHYDQKTLKYEAAGAFPESAGMSLESTVYYVSASGTVEILANGVRMYDPFTQETSNFARQYMIPEIRQIKHAFSPELMERYIVGSWTGTLKPEVSYPMAYMTGMELTADGSITIHVANTENDTVASYSGSYVLEDGILKTLFRLPLKYRIVTDERTIECSFEQQPEGILMFTETGYNIFLNIFSSQLFAH